MTNEEKDAALEILMRENKELRVEVDRLNAEISRLKIEQITQVQDSVSAMMSQLEKRILQSAGR